MNSMTITQRRKEAAAYAKKVRKEWEKRLGKDTKWLRMGVL